MQRNPLLKAIARGQIYIENVSPPESKRSTHNPSLVAANWDPRGVNFNTVTALINAYGDAGTCGHIAVVEDIMVPQEEYCLPIYEPCVLSATFTLVDCLFWDCMVVEPCFSNFFG